MGVDEAAPGGGDGIRVLLRRKQVDSDRARAAGGHQLAKELSVTQLIAIGARSSPPLSLSLSSDFPWGSTRQHRAAATRSGCCCGGSRWTLIGPAPPAAISSPRSSPSRSSSPSSEQNRMILEKQRRRKGPYNYRYRHIKSGDFLTTK
ncbi:hypothetical protein ZWY2020_026897 [Hordeum vulgare]|nr:hypothetical protein ZWY2020_026897 [Hordeum vulgare]